MKSFAIRLDAALAGEVFTFVTIDFKYPAAQRIAEENDHQTMIKRMKEMFHIYNSFVKRKQFMRSS